MSLSITRRQFGLAALLGAGGAVGVLTKRELGGGHRPSSAGPGNDGAGGGPTAEVRVRSTPVRIEPYPDLVELVPPKQAANLLSRLAPCWYPLKTGKVMHAFRLWGRDAVFSPNLYTYPFSNPVLSGEELTSYLLDDTTYRRYAPGASALLSRTPHGVRVRVQPDRFTGTFTGDLGHVDDVLAGCGEVGLPSGTVVRTPGGEGTLAEVVWNSVAEFRADQELDWTVEAFARYLDGTDRWVNQAGDVTTYSDIADRLLRRPYGEGPCLGTHTLNALACLYRVDECRQILTPQTRMTIQNYLKEASLMVAGARMGTGFWGGAWAPTPDRPLTRRESEQLAVTSTGHHLEWMAIVPPELRPDRKVIQLATSGILGVVEEMTPYARDRSYLDLSHLGRALSLMLGRHPSDVVRENVRV